MNTRKIINSVAFGSYLQRQDFCKKHNIFQQKKEILKILQMGEELLESDANLKYNHFFFQQHLKNGYSPKDLMTDDIEQIIYDRNPKKRNLMKMMLDYFNSNIILSEDYSTEIENIINSVQEGKNIFVITNHTTFANIPIIISTLQQRAKEFGTVDINDKMITVLGPALMTQKQKSVIQGISHIYKTHPKTANGLIPGLESKQARKSGEFGIELFKRCKDNAGNIVFIAPTATRDIIERTDQDKNNIYFGDDTNDSVQATLQAIVQKSLIQRNGNETRKENNRVVLIGVNDSQLKNPQYVNPTNNERHKNADIFLAIKSYNSNEILQHIEEKTVMEQLANLVIDHTGNSIATVLDAEKLSIIKEEITKKQTSQTK